MLKTIKPDRHYSLACATSMGVRITPEDRMAVQNSNRFYMQATSAETNVLNVASSLGLPCLAMTKFVAGSPIAAFIKGELRKRGIDYTDIEVPQGLVPGDTGTSSTSRTADSVCVRRGYGMTVPARSAEPCAPRILTLTASLSATAWAFCTCPD